MSVAVNEWFNSFAWLALNTERDSSTCQSAVRDGFLGPLWELHVIEPSSFICRSPKVSVCSLCGRVCISWLQGGGMLAGRVARLSSLCLGQPLGHSGLSGNPSLEWHHSRHPRGKPKRWWLFKNNHSCQKKIEQSDEIQNTSFYCVLIETWRHILYIKSSCFEVTLIVEYTVYSYHWQK